MSSKPEPEKEAESAPKKTALVVHIVVFLLVTAMAASAGFGVSMFLKPGKPEMAAEAQADNAHGEMNDKEKAPKLDEHGDLIKGEEHAKEGEGMAKVYAKPLAPILTNLVESVMCFIATDILSCGFMFLNSIKALYLTIAVESFNATNNDLVYELGRRLDSATGPGQNFNTNRVGNVRRHWKIPVYQAPSTPPEGELLTVQGAADKLGVAPSTLHRWLMDGYIAGEQVTPGAPWRIRMSRKLLDLFVAEVPEGYVSMPEAMRRLDVSRQTIMQRVKRGELPFVHVRRGKQKGLRIKVLDNQPRLFEESP